MNNDQEIILAKISAVYDKPPFVKMETGQMEMILKCVGLGAYYDKYREYLEPYWYNGRFQNPVESYRIFVGLNSIFEDLLNERKGDEIISLLTELGNYIPGTILSDEARFAADFNKLRQLYNLMGLQIVSMEVDEYSSKFQVEPYLNEGNQIIQSFGMERWLKSKYQDVYEAYESALNSFSSGDLGAAIESCRTALTGIFSKYKGVPFQKAKWMLGMATLTGDFTGTQSVDASEMTSIKNEIEAMGKRDIADFFEENLEGSYKKTKAIYSICASQKSEEPEFDGMFYTENYDELLEKVDAVYIVSKPEKHYIDTKKALLAGKHVLCESPIALKETDCEELYSIAEEHGLVLMDAIKTAYSTAYERLVLLAKTGKIGKVVSVDAVCTSLRDGISIAGTDLTQKWNSMCGWAPAALLPVFQILGTEYRKKVITTKFLDEAANMDAFTKIDFTYGDAVASIKVAKAAKSEGELIVTGTKGYIYVPAPWWKTDYFEVRYENAEDNQRFFYQLDGEGIRYEIVAFAKSVEVKKPMNYVEKGVSKSIAKIIESFNDRTDMIVI